MMSSVFPFTPSSAQLCLCMKLNTLSHLGPRKELDQLEVFAELCNLIQGQHIHIDFIGPDVAPLRSTFASLPSFVFLRLMHDNTACFCDNVLQKSI